ncbi:MAG: asparagine synthase (glutamine-hydrolyzing) [Magnetococcales bacterium]|nr:asparagine synthase (glutamine-hydrolyzing) [Magnetococcales bacterium]
MCGIAGLFDLAAERTPDAAWLQRMGDALRRRGPDGEGRFLAPGVGLIHRRLAVIDPANGAQPMGNEDGTVQVVFNGFIANHRYLAVQLEALGHVFRTRCDTEVLVHAWEEWGESCVERLRGMFAFVLWDEVRRMLFLARDRLGIKPLCYALLPGGWLAFASETSALTALPAFSRAFDPRAVECYLALGYVPDPLTIWRGASKLPPGYRLTVERGRGGVPQSYWDWRFAPQEPSASPTEVEAELDLRLRDAVAGLLESDVPLGAFLSGGVDSGAVTALMAAESEGPVTAFTMAFPGRPEDEAPAASAMASRFGARWLAEAADPLDPEAMQSFWTAYDEPFADSSAFPTWQLCRMARRHVTVALSGDGGDEVFAGYDRYGRFLQEERLRHHLPPQLLRGLGQLVAPLYRQAWEQLHWEAPGRRGLAGLALPSVAGYAHGVSMLGDAERQRLLAPEVVRELQGWRVSDLFLDVVKRSGSADPLSWMRYLDAKTFLAGRVLVKVDRASMAHGLEVRVPWLDHGLVEWAGRLPSHWHHRGGRGKHLFKRTLARYLPVSVLEGRKRGFVPPLGAWLRGGRRSEVERLARGGEGLLARAGWCDPAAAARLAGDCLAGKTEYDAAIWMLLMGEKFLGKVLD